MSKKLLRKKLALMLANLKKKRPYYCELEYIESSGTQYIDLGMTGNQDTSYRITFQSTQTAQQGIVFGSRTNATTNNISTISPAESSGTYANVVNDFGNYKSTRQIVSVNLLNDKLTVYNSKNERSVYNHRTGQTSKTTTQFTGTFTTPTNLYIGYKGSGFASVHYNFIGKHFGCEVWDNGVLVRDIIPVLDWDFVPCMYDRITGQFFYNKGTGNFTCGREIHYVDYIESSGTQYIDTGFNPTSKTRWEYDYQFDSISSSYIGNGMFISSPSTQRFAIGLIDDYFNMSYGADNVVPVPSDTDRHMFIIDANNMYWKIDNSTGTYSTQVTASLSRSIYFFARNGGSLYNAHSGKLYGSKIYDDGTLVRDYSPAIDENGVGFMFDKVTHTIYDNAGTGAFKYPARELEYIEATGTQYLNTGWNPGANAGQFTFEVEVNCTQNSSGHGAIGSRSVTAGRNWVITNINNSQLGIVSQYGYGDTYQDVVANTSDKWAKMRTYVDGSNYVFETTVDGVTSSGYTPVQSFTNTANVYLMGINNKGSLFSSFPFRGKIRRAKLYDRGTLVKDYRPAFKNGYFGLWDAVNDYLPGITGTVTHGKIVEPEYE